MFNIVEDLVMGLAIDAILDEIFEGINNDQ